MKKYLLIILAVFFVSTGALFGQKIGIYLNDPPKVKAQKYVEMSTSVYGLTKKQQKKIYKIQLDLYEKELKAREELATNRPTVVNKDTRVVGYVNPQIYRDAAVAMREVLTPEQREIMDERERKQEEANVEYRNKNQYESFIGELAQFYSFSSEQQSRLRENPAMANYFNAQMAVNAKGTDVSTEEYAALLDVMPEMGNALFEEMSLEQRNKAVVSAKLSNPLFAMSTAEELAKTQVDQLSGLAGLTEQQREVIYECQVAVNELLKVLHEKAPDATIEEHKAHLAKTIELNRLIKETLTPEQRQRIAEKQKDAYVGNIKRSGAQGIR